MPELPEVETVRLGLLEKVLTLKIESVKINLPRLVIFPPKNLLGTSDLIHSRIYDIQRKGKYLLFYLDNGKDLMIHLGMSGRIFYQPQNNTHPRHCHFIVGFENKMEMRFIDPRTFGKIALFDHLDYAPLAGLHHIGLDPLSPEYTLVNFKSCLQGKRKIKAFLLDQQYLSGIGNIYADECLYDAGIHPLTLTHRLHDGQIKRLFKGIKTILKKSVSKGGTTIHTFENTDQNFGQYQHCLKVYGRKDEPCQRCHTPIKRILVVQRSTYYCPGCQHKR
jgi:formamidopyrimidine-DNA glycosylase